MTDTPTPEATPCPPLAHNDFPAASENGARFGRPTSTVDGHTVGALIGAAMDSCRPCQDAALDTLQTDPLTVAYLVELCGRMAQSTFGGVPEIMTTRHDPSGRFSEPFRAALRAGSDAGDDHRGMFDAVAELDTAALRVVADEAVDMIVGHLTVMPALIDPEGFAR